MSQTVKVPRYALLKKRSRWRRRFFILLVVWIITSLFSSFPTTRGLLAYPLYVHEGDASGDAAYVMADGYAYWERVHAASDLYHMGRVPRVIVLAEDEPAGFNFVQNKTETRLQRTVAYLEWLGVPTEDISTVRVESAGMFGSLNEARTVADQETKLQRLVVVTSAPHTRRTQFCFRRTLPPHIQLQVYAASPPSQSHEIDAPLWIEYIKLLVYYVIV